MKERKGTRKVEGRKGLLNGFEDFLDLSAIVEFDYPRDQFSAFQNFKKVKTGVQYQFVFAFSLMGIHPFLSDEDYALKEEEIEQALKTAPLGESMTFRLVSDSNCERRVAHLNSLKAMAATPELEYLIDCEIDHVEDLSALGYRRPKTLTCYCTYTPEQPKPDEDWFESWVIKPFKPFWDKLTDQVEAKQGESLRQLYNKVYQNGYVTWKNFLAERLGFHIVPFSKEELWADLWYRFNSAEPCHIPQYLSVNQDAIEEFVFDEFHSTAHLCPNGPPFNDHRFVKVKDQYVIPLVYQQKPSGWRTPKDQLMFLWENAVSRDDLPDIEIVTELRPSNPKTVELQAAKLAKQEETKRRVDQEKGFDNRYAKKSQDKATAALDSLLDNDIPFYASTVFFLKRDDYQTAQFDAQKLSSCFPSPSVVMQEQQVAFRLWYDALPIVMRPMLKKVGGDRRPQLHASEVTGLVPLAKTHTPAQRGLELEAEDGTPVWIDFFVNHQHLGIMATQRAGKSVLVSQVLTTAQVYDIPIVALDFPKGDGSSTFSTYTEFFGDNGAYFNIQEQSSNIFELPDLRDLSRSQKKSRFADFKNFLKDALLLLIGDVDSSLKTTVQSVIQIALTKFFEDRYIHDSYQGALDHGLGSEEWRLMPTLRTFKDNFCNKGALPANLTTSDKIDGALEIINIRLEYWLESTVGKAISQPSTFRADANLLIFALKNLSSGEDAEVLALSAYAAALRRSLSHPKSIFFIDEAPILFKFPAIARLVATLTANGAKSGIRVIVAMQDPNTVAESDVGAQVLQNLTCKLIGRIEGAALTSFEKYLGYERAEILPNTKFIPKKGDMYTRWLLDNEGVKTQVRFYVPPQLLALVANNPDEQRKRQELLDSYEDKYEAIDAFAEALIDVNSTGSKFYENEQKEKPQQEGEGWADRSRDAA